MKDRLGHKAIVLAASFFFLWLPACERSKDGASTKKAAPASTVGKTIEPPRFNDVLSATGITFTHHFLDTETGSRYRVNPYDHGSGLAIADVNNDGKEDIYFLDFLGPNHLYINQGSMRFTEQAGPAGIRVDRSLSVGAAFGDYDNDGFQDLYVTTYRGGNHLFHNRGDGTFEDVTGKAGVGYNGHSSSPTWFDYDLDGDLDLYVCNIGKFTTETISLEADYFFEGVPLPFEEVAKTPDNKLPGEADLFFRNDGDGTFTDLTKEAGLGANDWNADAAVADIDLDGYPDLYVSNMFGANHLFRNRGDGTFEDVTPTALGRTSWGGMGSRFFDANADAYPDLYVVDMHSDMWSDTDDIGEIKPPEKFDTVMGARVSFGKVIKKPDDTMAKSVLFGNTFFTNRGDGTFAEQSADAGLETWWPWGIATGDFNNNGHEDIFVAGGMGYPYFYWPNRLFLNDGSGKFQDAASAAGVEPPRAGTVLKGAAINGKPFYRSSRATASADLDGDGDLDLVVNNFNHEPYFFRNDTPDKNHLRLKLRGTTSNRDAIGARIKVTAGGRTWHRWVSSAEGYLTQSSRIAHIGLGSVSSVDQVEVLWPGSSTPQTVANPKINEVIEIVQQ